MNPSLETHVPDLPIEDTFPEAWLPYLHENVFLYGLLSPQDQAKLRWLVPRFIDSKFWEGCAGLCITDEIRVTIAGQACLLLLGLDGNCFEGLRTILVYPGGYLGVAEDQLGRETNSGHRLGEAHADGPIVLSWWHACWGGRHRGQTNLVLHEFAHKMAERGDWNTGLPPLNDPRDIERWEKVFTAEHEQLIEDAEYHRPTVLHPYGATNPVEFFAVASETFFLQPAALRRRHPQLYQLLAEWYRQDPAEWRINAEAAARTRQAEELYHRHTLAECDAALRRYPDYHEAYWQRAEGYCWLGEFDKAIGDYTQLLELIPREERADAYHERGLAQREAEDFLQAIADFTESIYLRPDWASAYCERGATYTARGEYRKARADLNRALQLDPKDDWSYLQRGHLWRKAGKYDRAERDLTRALRLCPHRSETYFERALAYLEQKQYEEALSDCNEAIRLDPDSTETYRVRADVYEAKSQKELAQRDREEAARREE